MITVNATVIIIVVMISRLVSSWRILFLDDDNDLTHFDGLSALTRANEKGERHSGSLGECWWMVDGGIL